MTPLRRVVIVGNGIAGVTAADALRESGFAGELILVGDEHHPAYSRPALSKALLHEADYADSHLLPPPRHGATELRGVKASSLDVESRVVSLEDGRQLEFDGLVIATGCRPRRIGGEDGPDQVTLRTLDDAIALRAAVEDRPTVVVIGGGPLGMEVASGALAHGCEVTVVSLDPPMGLQLGEYLSDLIVTAAVDRGLRLVRIGAEGIEQDAGRAQVRLSDGSRISADLIVSAIGDIPNVEWLAGSGLLQDGLLVADELGRVAPGIVAAGDVATVPTPLGLRRVPLWNSAIEQARVAAASLIGAPTPVGAIAGEPGRSARSTPLSLPYFWTDQFGLSIKAVGHAPFSGEPVVAAGEDVETGLLLQWPDDGSGRGGAAAAVNHRIAIPKLRALANAAAPR